MPCEHPHGVIWIQCDSFDGWYHCICIGHHIHINELDKNGEGCAP